MNRRNKYIEYAYHGGPYDRGGADSYYRRTGEPHKWPDGTLKGTKVTEEFLSDEERQAYWAGFNENEEEGNFKDWG